MARIPIKIPDEAIGYNQDAKLATMQVIEWLVGIENAVKKGRSLVVVSSDKGELEVESPVSGTLVEICHQAGGGPIALTEVLGYIETGS